MKCSKASPSRASSRLLARARLAARQRLDLVHDVDDDVARLVSLGEIPPGYREGLVRYRDDVSARFLALASLLGGRLPVRVCRIGYDPPTS